MEDITPCIITKNYAKCRTTKRKFPNSRNEAVLSGVAIDCETQTPLKLVVLNINDSIFYSDKEKQGRFHKVLPPGRYSISIGWPGYKLQTINTYLKAQDSLYVVAYLKEITTPLE
ncbi:hypothetical protein WBJ53_04570 [Spirosoma sp. SC4-14]|uniref:hypothetical protein n=1 Tax=Spirosoma sp. SC4-14 TaxID=3128900 RepID=UPI0030CD5FA9